MTVLHPPFAAKSWLNLIRASLHGSADASESVMFRAWVESGGNCAEGTKLSRFGLWALGAAAVLTGAAGMIALDRYGILSVAPASQASRIEPISVVTETVLAPALPPADRFAFVSIDAVRLLLPPSDISLRGSIEPGTETPAAPSAPWIAETRREAHPAPHDDQTRTSAWTLESDPQDRPRRIAPLPSNRVRTPALTKRLAEISPGAMKRLVEKFVAAKASWPPAEIALVTIKDERTVELFGRTQDGPWQFVHRYKILAASGGTGPKLRQGDKQVPEGLYRIAYLNPLSAYHVSLRVNYPNAFDRKMAIADRRSGDLGGDIMFHGKNVSAGCIAVGDEAAEELFVLADYVSTRNIQVIVAPTDFRRHPIPALDETKPKWLPKLYAEVAAAMADFKAPPRPVLSSPIGLTAFFGN